MMKKTILLSLFLVSIMVIAAPPKFVKDCADCHGKNGVSTESDVPTIAGASAAFIEETFYSYKNGMRPAIESKYRSGDTSRAATDMKKIAEQFTDEQVVALARFFTNQYFVAAKQDFDATQVETGKKIHMEKCEECHGEGGSSDEDDAGILAGQWTPYLVNAMNNILNETRDTNEEMKKEIKILTDKEWRALLHYYASQQG